VTKKMRAGIRCNGSQGISGHRGFAARAETDRRPHDEIERAQTGNAETDLNASISGNEVVVTHRSQGHVYRFPILANGAVSLHGSRIEPNPKAHREAGRFVFDAHVAACIAWDRVSHT